MRANSSIFILHLLIHSMFVKSFVALFLVIKEFQFLINYFDLILKQHFTFQRLTIQRHLNHETSVKYI